MLALSLRRALSLIEKNQGRPYDTFKGDEAKNNLSDLINLCDTNLGIVMSKTRAVARFADSTSFATPPAPMGPEMESCIWRPR